MLFIDKKKRLKTWICSLDETDDRKRLSAIRKLGKSGNPHVIEDLVNKALQRKITSDIEACKDALLYLNDPRVEIALIRHLGEFAGLRSSAAQTLAEIGKPYWQEIILGDDGDFMRLGKSENPHAIEPLIIAMSNYDEASRRAAASAMTVKTGESHWVSTIKGDYDDFKRLADLDHPLTIEILLKALRLRQIDYNWYDEAAMLIAKLNDQRTIDHLKKALNDITDKYTREGSADVLGRIGDKEALIPLTQALNDFERNVRCAAAKSIGMIGGADSISPLIKALNDEESWVRQAAAEALIELAKDDFSLVGKEWKKVSRRIKVSHKDHYDGVNESYSDCNDHEDNSKHTDKGIGLEIPSELKI